MKTEFVKGVHYHVSYLKIEGETMFCVTAQNNPTHVDVELRNDIYHITKRFELPAEDYAAREYVNALAWAFDAGIKQQKKNTRAALASIQGL